MKIRAYQPQDKNALLDIWLRASTQAHHFIGVDKLEAQLPLVEQQYLPAAQIWISVAAAGHISGFIALMQYHIGALFVDPYNQGAGHGSALLHKAKSLHPVLTVGVYTRNVKAYKFYQRNGFCETGTEIQEETGEEVINMLFRG